MSTFAPEGKGPDLLIVIGAAPTMLEMAFGHALRTGAVAFRQNLTAIEGGKQKRKRSRQRADLKLVGETS
jgi:hypothetical protein